MKILHILETADPRYGGPVEGAIRTAEAWLKVGHEQDLLTLDAADAPFIAGYPGRVLATGRERGRLPWQRYGYAPGVIAKIRSIRRDYDAVIVSGLWNFSIMAARFALADGATPYFVYTHGMLDPWFRKTYPLKHVAKQAFWLFNEGPLLKNADAVLFTTEEEARVAQDAFRPYSVRTRIVGYGASDVPDDEAAQLDAFHREFPALATRPFLLFLGRLHPKKGVDLLIEGFARSRLYNRLQLVLAGPGDAGYVEELKALAWQRGVGEAVRFVGMLTGSAKWGAFRACDAFALISHQENFGVAVAEALACSKPVLISNKVNIWREVEEDGAGLVTTDDESGAESILTGFSALTADERATMAGRARQCFLRRYQFDAAARQLLHVIEEALSERRKDA